MVKSEIKTKFANYRKTAVLLIIAVFTGIYALFFVLLGVSQLINAGLIELGLPITMGMWCAPLILSVLLGFIGLYFTLKATEKIEGPTK